MRGKSVCFRQLLHRVAGEELPVGAPCRRLAQDGLGAVLAELDDVPSLGLGPGAARAVEPRRLVRPCEDARSPERAPVHARARSAGVATRAGATACGDAAALHHARIPGTGRRRLGPRRVPRGGRHPSAAPRTRWAPAYTLKRPSLTKPRSAEASPPALRLDGEGGGSADRGHDGHPRHPGLLQKLEARPAAQHEDAAPQGKARPAAERPARPACRTRAVPAHVLAHLVRSVPVCVEEAGAVQPPRRARTSTGRARSGRGQGAHDARAHVHPLVRGREGASHADRVDGGSCCTPRSSSVT